MRSFSRPRSAEGRKKRNHSLLKAKAKTKRDQKRRLLADNYRLANRPERHPWSRIPQDYKHRGGRQRQVFSKMIKPTRRGQKRREALNLKTLPEQK